MDSQVALGVAEIALIGAIVTAAGAFLGILLGNLFTKRIKDRELFQEALHFVEGGTQKRAIGIAVLKMYARQVGLKQVVIDIFKAQITYLRGKGYATPNSESGIEYQNYSTMVEALHQWGSLERDCTCVECKPGP